MDWDVGREERRWGVAGMITLTKDGMETNPAQWRCEAADERAGEKRRVQEGLDGRQLQTRYALPIHSPHTLSPMLWQRTSTGLSQR